jgi:hypothetical protein
MLPSHQLIINHSPRWLYTTGDTDGARKTLARLHSHNGDPNSPLVNLEIEEISEKIKINGADSKPSLYHTIKILVTGC